MKYSNAKFFIIALNIAIISFGAYLCIENSEMAIALIIIISAILLFIDGLFYFEKKWAIKSFTALPVDYTITPIVQSNCLHVCGLPVPTDSQCQIKIFKDNMTFHIGTQTISLPMDRVISIDKVTKEQSEYVMKKSIGKALVGGALLGQAGFIFGAMPKDKIQKTLEDYLMITYEKEDTMQFITLGNINCYHIINKVSDFITFKPNNIEL